MYTHNYYKKIFTFYKKIYNYIKKKNSKQRSYKKFFCLLNIRMVNPGLNLSLNELRLKAEHRNISENINLQKI